MLKFKTFEECCKKVGVDPKIQPDVSMVSEEFRKRLIADYKLMIITKAHNNGWVPDYTNSSQRKYTVWLEVKADKKRPGGFGFSRVGYDVWNSGTFVGSRLCFETSEQAIYVCKQFNKLWIEHQLMV